MAGVSAYRRSETAGPFRFLRSDVGLTTLAELLVAMVLLGMVLVGTWAVQVAMNRAIQVNTNVTAAGGTFGDPMEFIGQILMQRRYMVASGMTTSPAGQSVNVSSLVPTASSPATYGLAVATDRVATDTVWEINYFYIDPSKGTLMWTAWPMSNTTNLPVPGKLGPYAMSRWVTTGSSAPPLFAYQTASGAATSAVAASRVKVTLTVKASDGATSTDSRIIWFRN